MLPRFVTLLLSNLLNCRQKLVALWLDIQRYFLKLEERFFGDEALDSFEEGLLFLLQALREMGVSLNMVFCTSNVKFLAFLRLF